MGVQLSWFERTPDKREVDGSSPFRPTNKNLTVFVKCSLKTEQKYKHCESKQKCERNLWVTNLLVQTISTFLKQDQDSQIIGQAKKSTRGMPWHWEPMKDVTSCDKLRGGANNLRSGDFRMGKPTWSHFHVLATEYIGCKREPPELKHLSRARKSNQTRFREQWRAKAEEAKP